MITADIGKLVDQWDLGIVIFFFVLREVDDKPLVGICWNWDELGFGFRLSDPPGCSNIPPKLW